MLDFWEYSHGFDSEDGAIPIDEDVTFEATRQEFLTRHEEEIPATLEKLAKEEAKKRKKNNRENRKKEVLICI